MSVRVVPMTGLQILAAVPALARLRVEVFRDWPYLYDGTVAYESAYLERYTRSNGAIVAAALDGETIVGAATAMPLADHDPAFSEPFRRRGDEISRIYYCSESVLSPTYRGQGLGHAFFDVREDHARALGRFTHVTFCAVERPAGHPLTPADYRPLDGFWHKRGYERLVGVTTQFSWKDLDQADETPKTMQYWMKAL